MLSVGKLLQIWKWSGQTTCVLQEIIIVSDNKDENFGLQSTFIGCSPVSLISGNILPVIFCSLVKYANCLLFLKNN